jgi:DNA primase
VAPLGTALTEDQLGLLWRHADEPILCFDGDKAGQRAAFRALDIALPLLAPGRSLRIALLPGGQDPDDLLRSGGPAAIDQVLTAALPLSELLWRRALEAGPVDTPERRAGLTQTLRTTVATIRDETVRRYYRDDIEERLRSLSPRSARAAAGGAPRGRPRFTRPGEPVSPRITGSPSPSVTASAGFTGAAPVREAVIVGTLLAHPEMMAEFGEEAAELDFADPDARALLSVLLACAAEDEDTAPEVLQNRINRAGLTGAADRILALARSRDRTTLAPHADPAHRADALRQAMILHRQAGALHSELREARQAFEDDPTDAGWAWLCEVKARLETVIAAEAEADAPVSSDSTAV